MILFSSSTEIFEAAGCQQANYIPTISFTFCMVVKVVLLLWQKFSKETLRKQRVLEIIQDLIKEETDASRHYTKLTLLRREKHFTRHPLFSGDYNPMDKSLR